MLPHLPALLFVLPSWRGRAAARAATLVRMLALALALALAPALASAAGVPAATAAPLPPEVDAALARARVPREALVAIVADVDPARRDAVRLAWQPRQPVNPASLMKLLTTSAALELLGPAYAWATPVWLQGKVGANGVLDGNLVIQGQGDPTLVLERVWLLLRRVQQLGVRQIRGDIVLDRSAFALPAGEPGAAAFDGEALRPYNVQPDALLLNHKAIALTLTPDTARGVATVVAEPALAGVKVDATLPLASGPCDDWRAAAQADASDPARLRFAGRFPAACGEKTWQLAYGDPASYNARLLAALWAEMGGTLSGRVRDGAAPATPPTFELASRTLPEVVRDINKFSNNVMAQQLFLTLGRGGFAGAAAPATPEAAREVLRRWLGDRFGEAGRTAVVDNGSGLSRDNRVSAQLLADLLRAAWAGPVMPELLASLPVAGVDGTLRRSQGATGRAHLKTGSLRDVAGVAGVVLGASGRRYVLVAIVNHPNANAARPAFDALLQWAAADTAALAAVPANPAALAATPATPLNSPPTPNTE